MGLAILGPDPNYFSQKSQMLRRRCSGDLRKVPAHQSHRPFQPPTGRKTAVCWSSSVTVATMSLDSPRNIPEYLPHRKVICIYVEWMLMIGSWRQILRRV